jgi:hypothetical protein
VYLTINFDCGSMGGDNTLEKPFAASKRRSQIDAAANATNRTLAARMIRFFFSFSDHLQLSLSNAWRMSGSPTQLRIKAAHRRVRSKRLFGGGLEERTTRPITSRTISSRMRDHKSIQTK